jgi:hypothetical protein
MKGCLVTGKRTWRGIQLEALCQDANDYEPEAFEAWVRSESGGLAKARWVWVKGSARRLDARLGDWFEEVCLNWRLQ